MDKGIALDFFPSSKRVPHIQQLFEYECDGKEGHFMFDGYYYVDDLPSDIHSNSLPQTLRMRMRRYSTLPEDTETWFTQEMMLGCLSEVKHTKTKNLEDYDYTIEIYKRIKHQDTSYISEFEDEDGPARICFFPTHKQTLYFRVLTQSTLCTPSPPEALPCPSAPPPQS